MTVGFQTYSDDLMAATCQRLRDRYAKALAKPGAGGAMARPPAPTDLEGWTKFCQWRMGVGPRPEGLDPRWDTFDPPKPEEGTLYLPPSPAPAVDITALPLADLEGVDVPEYEEL